jgi:hypothetical protein
LFKTNFYYVYSEGLSQHFIFGSFGFEAFGSDICVDGLKKLAKTAYCVIFCGSFLVF